jgi:hypothetical protein
MKMRTFTLETREPSPESAMRSIHNDSKRGFRTVLYQTLQNAKDLIVENLQMNDKRKY